MSSNSRRLYEISNAQLSSLIQPLDKIIPQEQNSIGEQKANKPPDPSAPALPEIFEDFMSTAATSTSAAQGRFFVFEDECDSGFPRHPERSGKCEKRISCGVEGSPRSTNPRLTSVVPASRLSVRPVPEMVSSGIAEIDVLTGGLPRGCLSEIFGPPSSGRTTFLLASLAAATRRGECCALIDGSDAFDPQSAAAAGTDFDRLLWVRCTDNSRQMPRGAEKKNLTNNRFPKFENAEHRLEQLLRAADLLLESGGFGVIVLDLCDFPQEIARRIPMTTWFRFRRAVENTPTVMLAFQRQSIAGSCSTLQIKLQAAADPTKNETGNCTIPAHAQLLTKLKITAEVVRSRIERKPVCSEIGFTSKTAWAG